MKENTMDMLSVLPLLLVMVIVLLAGSIVFRSPRQNLQSAFAEGAIWSSSFFVAFGAEILLLVRI
jgi:hypothetical protein